MEFERDDYFELRPITLVQGDGRKKSGFILKPRSVEFVGRPTITQWRDAMSLAQAAELSSPFWIGDLWNYAEGREDWREQLSQALSEVGRGLSPKSLANRGAISKRLGPLARDLSPSLGHADAVASLPPGEQQEWLEKARTEELTVSEMRQLMRARKRRRIIDGQAVLEGKYRVWLVDCPWPYDDHGATADGSLGKAERHYPPMSYADLAKLPVEAHAMPNAVMGFWVPAPLMYDSPGPRDIWSAWGFTYRQHRVWDKVLGMPGAYGITGRHELFLILTRGEGRPDVPLPLDDSVYVERRSDEHSEKPAEFRRFLERHWTTGPYVEMFASTRTPGWSAFGNDARLGETAMVDEVSA